MLNGIQDVRDLASLKTIKGSAMLGWDRAAHMTKLLFDAAVKPFLAGDAVAPRVKELNIAEELDRKWGLSSIPRELLPPRHFVNQFAQQRADDFHQCKLARENLRSALPDADLSDSKWGGAKLDVSEETQNLRMDRAEMTRVEEAYRDTLPLVSAVSAVVKAHVGAHALKDADKKKSEGQSTELTVKPMTWLTRGFRYVMALAVTGYLRDKGLTPWICYRYVMALQVLLLKVDAAQGWHHVMAYDRKLRREVFLDDANGEDVDYVMIVSSPPSEPILNELQRARTEVAVKSISDRKAPRTRDQREPQESAKGSSKGRARRPKGGGDSPSRTPAKRPPKGTDESPGDKKPRASGRSEDSAICRDWVLGECSRGADRCRFWHDFKHAWFCPEAKKLFSGRDKKDSQSFRDFKKRGEDKKGGE
jgi:hypothetical protein